MNISAFCLAIAPVAVSAESIAPYVFEADLSNIISVITPSFNSAANFKAVLFKQGEAVSLYIFDGPFARTPTDYAIRITETGAFIGSIPWLEFAEDGTLLLHNESLDIGRLRWTSTLSIRKKHQAYVVTAYSYSAYDTLDLEYSRSCHYDFVSGRAQIDALEVTPPDFPAPVPIRRWQDTLVAQCLNGG